MTSYLSPLILLLVASNALAGEEASQTLSGVPYKLKGQTPRGISRIEYTSVTVDDLDLATDFYGDVLGGYEIDFCGTSTSYCSNGAVRVSGDIHMEAMFQYDIIKGSETPDISSSGDYEVLSKFFLLGNAVIQLVKFAQRSDGAVFDLRESRSSPCWMAKAHIDFWIEDGIDANDYIYDVETRAQALGGGGLDVKFNRPVPQETREDRDSVPLNEYANKVVGGSFDGLAWAYFKGVAGEQLEIYQMERTMKKAVGAAYCNRGAVSPAFVNKDTLTSNTSKYGWGGGGDETRSSKNYTSQKLHGLFQYGYRTSDLHKAAGFYTEVLGGSLITYPTQGIEIMRDDSAHWMILANETIEAYEYADAMNIMRAQALVEYGVANISSTGNYRLDHRFILFDNFVVEPLEYTSGLTFGADGFDPELNHSSSPAYIGTITAAFGIDNSTTDTSSLAEYLGFLQERVTEQGYHTVSIPEDTATFETDHPYSGLEYVFLKGPDGEAIELVHISGRFREVLYDALIAAGGVSTMFNDTDPYAKGDMDLFCPYALYSPNYVTLTEAETTDDATCSSVYNYYSTSDESDNDDQNVLFYLLLSTLVCAVVVILLLTGMIAMISQMSNKISDPDNKQMTRSTEMCSSNPLNT